MKINIEQVKNVKLKMQQCLACNISKGSGDKR